MEFIVWSLGASIRNLLDELGALYIEYNTRDSTYFKKCNGIGILNTYTI